MSNLAKAIRSAFTDEKQEEQQDMSMKKGRSALAAAILGATAAISGGGGTDTPVQVPMRPDGKTDQATLTDDPVSVEPTPVAQVFAHLRQHEGASGDTLTDTPTGKLGVTAAARAAVPGSDKMADETVARKYIELLDTKASSSFENWGDVPSGVRAAVLDLAYNLGEGALAYPNMSRHLREGNWQEAMKSTLATARADGFAVRGLAVRRAANWNQAFPDAPITDVEMGRDGTITYWQGSKKLFSYRPGPRHPDSTAMKQNLGDGEETQVAQRPQEGRRKETDPTDGEA
jgi:GH24 family phage-related lysozyme (muramidase)